MVGVHTYTEKKNHFQGTYKYILPTCTKGVYHVFSQKASQMLAPCPSAAQIPFPPSCGLAGTC